MALSGVSMFAVKMHDGRPERPEKGFVKMGKMLSVALAAIVLTTLSGVSGAETLKSRVGVWGGYGKVGLKELNKAMDEISVQFTGKEVKDLTEEAAVGVEGGYAISSNVLLCAKIGYMGTSNLASVEKELPILGSAKFTASGSAVPMMGGIRYMVPLADRLSAGLGAYAGVAQVTANVAVSAELFGIKKTMNVGYDGTAPAVQGLACMEYRLVDNLSVSGDVGYIFLRAPDISAIKAANVDTSAISGLGGVVDVAKGAKLKDEKGDKVEMDMSGWAVEFAMNYLF